MKQICNPEESDYILTLYKDRETGSIFEGYDVHMYVGSAKKKKVEKSKSVLQYAQ